MLILTKRKKFILFFLNLIVRILFIPIRIFLAFRRRDPRPVKKILVLELWGIGDVIMATPVLSALRQRYPDAKICMLAKEHATELLQESNLIDDIITYDFPWTKFRGKYWLWEWDFRKLINFIKLLRQQKFDLAVCSRGDFRNNFLMFLSGAELRVGYNFTGGEYFLTDVVPIDFTKPHRVDEWLNLAEYLRCNTSEAKPTLTLSEEEKAWADAFLKEHGIMNSDFLLGIHPGAGINIRYWPINRFAKVATYTREHTDAKILVFVEPGGYGENIPMDGDFIKVRVPLRKLIALIDRLNLLICNDSGPMHISTGVDTPVVAIFGPGDKNRIGPYGAKNRVVMQDNIACRPCFDCCKFSEPFCITRISVNQVLEQIDKKLTSIFEESTL